MLDIIIFAGYLSAYGLWPTEAQTAYQQHHGNIPMEISHYDALIAVPNCDLIGHDGIMTIVPQEQLWNMGPVEGGEYAILVYDCGGAGDGIGHNWMIDNNIAAEVDYYFWMEYPEYVGTGIEVTIEINKHGT